MATSPSNQSNPQLIPHLIMPHDNTWQAASDSTTQLLITQDRNMSSVQHHNGITNNSYQPFCTSPRSASSLLDTIHSTLLLLSHYPFPACIRDSIQLFPRLSLLGLLPAPYSPKARKNESGNRETLDHNTHSITVYTIQRPMLSRHVDTSYGTVKILVPHPVSLKYAGLTCHG